MQLTARAGSGGLSAGHAPKASARRLHRSLVHASRMSPSPTTSSSRQLWTPSRGISFAAGPNGMPPRPASSPPTAAATINPSIAPIANQSPQPTLNLARFMHNEAVGKIHKPVKTNADASEPGSVPSRGFTSPSGKATVPNAFPSAPPGNAIPVKTAASTRKYAAPKLSWEVVFSRPTVHPENDLEWKIPNDVFSQLRKGEDGKPQAFYSHTFYRGPGRHGQDSKVTVHYCRSVATTEQVCQQYFLNQPVIGFDIEWEMNATRMDGARANVSLVQIATPSRIALFHLALFPRNPPSLIAPTLKRIIEDPSVMKCGVMILGDFSRLKNFLGLNPRGAMELSHYHNLVTFCKLGKKGPVPKKPARLADQVVQVLGLPMFKGESVRTSEWSRELKIDQIYYSASDAYAGLQLYAVYEHERKKLRPCPPRPPLAELGLKMVTKGDDGITEAEELAFLEAEQNVRGTVTLEDKILASKTTRTVAQTTKTEETDQAILTTTTMATATITQTTFTTTTPKKRTSPAAQLSAAGSSSWAPEVSVLATEEPVPTTSATTQTKPTPRKRRSTTTSSRSRSLSPDPVVADATAWANDFRKAHSDSLSRVSGLSRLRAYRLWSANPPRSTTEVAALLGDPPLLSRTVAEYVCGVVRYHSSLRPDGGHGLIVSDHNRLFEDVLKRVGRKRVPGWLLDAIGRDPNELPLWGIGEDGSEIRVRAAASSGRGKNEDVGVDTDDGASILDDALPTLEDNAISMTARAEHGQPGNLQVVEEEDSDMPDATERSISPTPSETDLLFALDRQLGEATDKGEAMKMSTDRDTWQALGVERDVERGVAVMAEGEGKQQLFYGDNTDSDDGWGGFRCASPSPSEMEVMMELAENYST